MDAELQQADDQFIAGEAYTGGPDVYDDSLMEVTEVPGGSAARAGNVHHNINANL